MEFKFYRSVAHEIGPSKKERLLALLREGDRGTMQHFAKKLKTSIHGVRSFINLLRVEGHPIFNEVMTGTRQTRYFLAKPTMKQKQVHNKVYNSMRIPRGKHTLVIS